MTIDRRTVLRGGLLMGACACAAPYALFATTQQGAYICPPCGCAMDGKTFDGPGRCPACGMTLIPKPHDLPFEPSRLSEGSGTFQVAGGHGHAAKRITVDYYLPAGFTSRSPILIVLPGAGRNGDAYRDAWIASADDANVLVAALSYAESDYDFAAYQMGGVIKDLRIENLPSGPDGRPPSSVHLRDEDISFTLNPRPREWIFNDFDRVFSLIATATRSRRENYDLFGHSAGGQILHRLVLFHPNTSARRIVAANAGLYTLPDLAMPQPIGLRDTGVTRDSLARSFASELILMLGEKDADGELGGIQLHTPMFDRQGVDRLSRGRRFFEVGRDTASDMNTPFAWTLDVVPRVGHDFRAMSVAAAKRLYG